MIWSIFIQWKRKFQLFEVLLFGKFKSSQFFLNNAIILPYKNEFFEKILSQINSLNSF